MYLLRLYRDFDLVYSIGMFKEEKDYEKFLKSIPSCKAEEDGYNYRIYLDGFPALLKLKFNDADFILSRDIFLNREYLYVDVEEYPILNEYKGMYDKYQVIGAYAIGTDELEDYVTRRNKKLELVFKILDDMGIEAFRDYSDSEDGECIILKKDSSILFVLDPSFNEDLPDDEAGLRKAIEEELKNK